MNNKNNLSAQKSYRNRQTEQKRRKRNTSKATNAASTSSGFKRSENTKPDTAAGGAQRSNTDPQQKRRRRRRQGGHGDLGLHSPSHNTNSRGNFGSAPLSKPTREGRSNQARQIGVGRSTGAESSASDRTQRSQDSGLGNRDRNRRDGRRQRDQNHSDMYDIFGAKVEKSKGLLRRKSYQPEYVKIDLPQQLENLQCCICGNPITGNLDILEALEVYPGEFGQSIKTEACDSILSDSGSDSAHFECVLQALANRVQLENGDSVAYLGAGKFAVVHGPQRTVKQMIERNDWRQNSSLSPTNWPYWRQNLSSHTLIAALSIETDV